MAYNDFTLELLEKRFSLRYHEVTGAFEAVPPVPPSDLLKKVLERGLPVALGKGREKARSEAIIAPILFEVREQMEKRISVFSGPEFNVDRKQGLSGWCDFLLARSPHQSEIFAPVVTVVEAKHEDLTAGIPQCIAEMYAARLFNEKREKPVETTYGVVTTGSIWRFLSLTGLVVQADLREYYLSELDKILGILVHMVS
jgi:hypothetical protein